MHVFFLVLWLIAVTIQLVYLFMLFWPLLRVNDKSTDLDHKIQASPEVSVIIIVKNEISNLRQLIPLLLLQNYQGRWDIHIIDDHSTDGLREFADSLYSDQHHVYFHFSNDEVYRGKKQHLVKLKTLATYDWILFTDADCRPNSNGWIQDMVGHAHSDITLGFSPFFAENTMLNEVIQFETQTTGLLYLGAANRGNPYMGVGRNILYKKAAFLSINSLEKFDHIMSGDDDLSVNELAGNVNTSINLEPSTFMNSIPKNTFKGWINQKARHVSTAKFYHGKDQVLLLIYYASKIGWWLLVPVLAVWNFKILLAFAVSKWIYFILYRKLAKDLFRYNWTFLKWVRADLVYLLALIALIPASTFKKITRW
ncbi:MAG: glycosyltransferase [Saprospiraceae bacterium]